MPSTVPATTPEPAATRGRGANGGQRGSGPDAEPRPSLAWRLAPPLIAAAVAAVYLLLEPRTVDMAAASYRTHLFEEEGLAVWNGSWYGGHHTLGYSVLFPPLAGLLGPYLLGALSAVAMAALFEPLARHHFGERARWGSIWFGLAATAPVFSGRIPFALGCALGLAALLAFQRERRWLALALAVATALASPVAGLFLALAAVAYALARNWRTGTLLAAAALVPPVLLAVVFPEGGREPFDFSTFIPLPLLAIAFVILAPPSERVLRAGAALYALACVAAFAIDSPMGGNAARLAGLFGGPLLACVLLAHRRRAGALAVVALATLAFIQWSPPVRDVIKAYEDPSVDASYYRPLLQFLDRQGGPPYRVEIPFTRSHWEANEVARHYPLARGWVRQSDIERNGIFYDGVLNQFTYATWLTERGVRFVALPDAKPDYSAYRERALIESRPPYLKLRARLDHWQIFEVTLPRPMVVPRGRARFTVTSYGKQDVRLTASGAGEATVRVSWSPYWKADRGCVERAGEWTRLTVPAAGRVRISMDFSPGRVVSRGRRCA